MMKDISRAAVEAHGAPEADPRLERSTIPVVAMNLGETGPILGLPWPAGPEAGDAGQPTQLSDPRVTDEAGPTRLDRLVVLPEDDEQLRRPIASPGALLIPPTKTRT